MMISLYNQLTSFIQNYVIEDMMIYSEGIGLCATCNNVATCFHRRRHDQPVWQCEEFDDSDLTEEKQKDNANMQKVSMEEVNDNCDERPNRFGGLCSSCKHREVCTYSKPEGGVLCCEEYE